LTEGWLKASVHGYALRTYPAAYLTAAKWRILGKRVRARGQWAGLLSQAPNAYGLWALRQDSGTREPSPPDAAPAIIALINLAPGTRADDAEQTLASVTAEGLTALQIGSVETPTLADAAARIDWTQDPWLIPLVAGDKLARGAASAYRLAMREPSVRVVYADDDQISINGLRSTPHFKPDWNGELFCHFDYVTNACALRAEQADLVDLSDDRDWAQGLVIRAKKQGTPHHLRQVLHHRRKRMAPRLPARPLTVARDLPALSVIVPTRNRVDLLRTCLEGVAATDYPDIEVIVVDNDSDDPATLAFLDALDPVRYHVLHHCGPFNYSAINNRAVAHARGSLLCLLNNDIEVLQPGWLATMATQALRADVGAVGARLLYPDGRIQHAGVVIGVGNAAGHAHRFVRPEEPGYFHRHAMPQFTTAVTGACLVVAKDRFLAVGGLDERNFAVAFNDVDLCLRLNRQGWQSFYEPRATLVHHESVSRGFDHDPVGAARFAGELAALKRLWKTDEIFDPYHHPQLSRASERFAVAI
jgi:GT2 family glycosyltransferase